MKKSLMFCCAGIFAASLSVSNPGHAVPGIPFLNPLDAGASPTFQIDYGRSITGIITGVINLCNDGEQKAQLIATQEETNKQADGTEDASANSASQQASSGSGSASETAFSSGAYNYIKDKVWKKPYHYGALKQELGESPSKEKSKEAVMKVFFAPAGSETTYKERIYTQRQVYAETMTDFHIKLGNDIQKNIVADLRAAGSAPVSSDNEVGSLAIDAQTLDEMIKITLADLTLQIELMEADAMAFMLHQPVELLPNPDAE